MSSVSVQNSVGDGPRDQLQPMGLENQNNMLVEDNSSQGQEKQNEEYDTCLLDYVIEKSKKRGKEPLMDDQDTPPRKKINSGMDVGTIMRTGNSGMDVGGTILRTGSSKEEVH